MLDFLEKIIMSDVIVETMPETTAVGETGEVAAQFPGMWSILALLLLVVGLCIIFILNNKRKRVITVEAVKEDEKSSH